jgi:hypothetical protein
VNIEQVTADLWAGYSPEPEPTYCAYAAKFKQQVEVLYASITAAVRQDNTNPEQSARAAVAIGQAKVLLVDAYFNWRTAVPKSHRNYTGSGHICLWHVYEETYRTIRAAELCITPPLLFLPAPPPNRQPSSLSIADVVAFGPVSSRRR